MNINVDTMLCVTDEGTVGLYTSIDSFEKAIDDKPFVDLVEEYCKLFELSDAPHVISSDCYELIGDLRVELAKALEVVDTYIEATARDILQNGN